MKPIPIEDEAAGGAAAPSRDLLGHACFFLHFTVMLYMVLGWLLPERKALSFYLVFIPAILAQWRVNKDTCVLNNIEGWLRTGHWRNGEANPEEGAWLLSLARSVTEVAFTAVQINLLTYAVLALVWSLALARLIWRV